jgi:hypothetical protein
MLRLLPAGLQQLRVVVRDVKPFRLLVLIRVDKFVRQVLLGGVFTHLDAGSSDYSWVVDARLRLHTEEFSEQDPVGLDPHKGFTEMDEDGEVKNPIRGPLKKSLAGSASPRSTNRTNMGISSGFFSIRYRSPAAARHMSISFSLRNPLFTSARKSSVFALDFFHSLFGFGRGGDVGGVDS